METSQGGGGGQNWFGGGAKLKGEKIPFVGGVFCEVCFVRPVCILHYGSLQGIVAGRLFYVCYMWVCFIKWSNERHASNGIFRLVGVVLCEATPYASI